jgi:hypothetical protein
MGSPLQEIVAIFAVRFLTLVCPISEGFMNHLVHLLIYYLLLSTLLYGSLAYNPRMWLHRMPPEVTAKVPPKTPYEKTAAFKNRCHPLPVVVGRLSHHLCSSTRGELAALFSNPVCFFSWVRYMRHADPGPVDFLQTHTALYHHRRDRAARLFKCELSPDQRRKRFAHITTCFGCPGDSFAFHKACLTQASNLPKHGAAKQPPARRLFYYSSIIEIVEYGWTSR